MNAKTKTIPALLNVNDAIERFRERVVPLLDPSQEEQWDGVTLKAKEIRILQAGLELVGHCIAILISQLSLAESVKAAATLRARGQAGLRYVNQAFKEVSITLIGGVEVRFQTLYTLARPRTRRRGPKRPRGKRGTSRGQGFYPVLTLLGIRDGVSPLVRCQVTQAATQLPSFEQAVPFVAWLGLDFSTRRIRRISEAFCRTGLAARSEQMAQIAAGMVSPGGALAGKRVAIGADGGRINIRQTRRKGRKRKSGWPGYDTDWTEPKLFTISILDEHGKKLTGVDVPVGADGTLNGIDAFLKMLHLSLHTLGISQAEVVVLLGDGAHWIWDHIPPLLQELGCRATQILQVLDCCHAIQHVYDVGKAVFGVTKEGTAWAKRWAKKLKRGGAKALVMEIGRYLASKDCQDTETLQTEYNYFRTHQTHGRLEYASFNAHKVPIGSGAIESLIRQTVNLRMKSCSKAWLHENAEAFLHARCQWATHQWSHYCDTVLLFGLV